MLRTRAAVVLATAAAAALALAAGPAAAQPTRFSAAQLESGRGVINTRLTGSPYGVTGWGVDPASNRMVVSVLKGDTAALDAAQRAVAGFPQATIQTVTERPRPFYNLVGGLAISNSAGRCSEGFSARAGANVYLITAGHCTATGGSWVGDNGAPIGPVDRSSFPSNDYGTIRVTSSSWVPTAKVLLSPTTALTMTGSTEAAVGASVCRYGSTTGYHCGTILAKNQTVSYPNGRVSGVTKTNACAEPGDSGGSFFSGTQAQGLTSGGSGTCASGGITYFQPINEVLSAYGVRLVTSAAQPPNPAVLLCSNWKYSGACVSSELDHSYLGNDVVGNDAVSSIKVPAGWFLLLYADANYKGACQAFSKDVELLPDTGTVANDKASSFRIATTAAGCATS